MPRDKLIQPRRGTAAQWTSANPILAEAEFGYETDTLKMKMGDGITDWDSLAYVSTWGSGGGGGSGTVTSVSVTTANGVSGSVATATTTPAITLTLGAITPTSIVASGTIAASNLSGTNTGDQNLAPYATLASPTFTGTVTLPTGQVVNGVTLTAAGSASDYLRADGTYGASSASVAWGAITGTLSSQTDLQTALNAKAPLASPTFTGTVSGITAAMVGAPSGSGTSTGTNTGDQTSISGNAGTATALATGRTISITGDLAYISPSFDGSGNVTAAGTLANVNANVGSFTNASITVNAKGLITAASSGAGGSGLSRGLVNMQRLGATVG